MVEAALANPELVVKRLPFRRRPMRHAWKFQPIYFPAGASKRWPVPAHAVPASARALIEPG
jgi:hypothetical protein